MFCAFIDTCVGCITKCFDKISDHLVQNKKKYIDKSVLQYK